MKATICIPTWTTGHPMLMACVRNVRATTGGEPVVWRTDANVAVARSQATAALDTDYICFLDTDAFPQERGWLSRLVQTAEETGADIVSPNEILWFSATQLTPLWPDREQPYKIKRPRVAGMCVLVRRGRGVWDPYIGLTHGRLGPCIEDTDFAFSVAAQGGVHIHEPRVHVYHKDRGTPNYETWMLTHEYLCYQMMSILLQFKWQVIPSDKRASFFSDLGSVPGQGQRYLAEGYTIEHLIECYAPIAERVTGLEKEALWCLENTADRYLMMLRREEGRLEMPPEMKRDIRGRWSGPQAILGKRLPQTNA